MNDNWLLAEKHRTQRALDDMAEHDLIKYASDTHARVEALAVRHGFELKYGTPRQLKSNSENPTVSIV